MVETLEQYIERRLLELFSERYGYPITYGLRCAECLTIVEIGHLPPCRFYKPALGILNVTGIMPECEP